MISNRDDASNSGTDSGTDASSAQDIDSIPEEDPEEEVFIVESNAVV